MNNGTFQNVSFYHFAEEARVFFEFIESTPNVSIAQVEAGIKTLSLLFFGQSTGWTDFECQGFICVHELAHKELMAIKYKKAIQRQTGST